MSNQVISQNYQIIKKNIKLKSSEYFRTKESLAASVSELITNTNNMKDDFIKASKDQENQIKVNIKGIGSEISSGALFKDGSSRFTTAPYFNLDLVVSPCGCRTFLTV